MTLRTTEGLTRINTHRLESPGRCTPAPIQAGPHLARRKQDGERFADTQIDLTAPIHEDQSGDRDTSRVFQAVTAVALFALCCLIWWAYHALEVSV